MYDKTFYSGQELLIFGELENFCELAQPDFKIGEYVVTTPEHLFGHTCALDGHYHMEISTFHFPETDLSSFFDLGNETTSLGT